MTSLTSIKVSNFEKVFIISLVEDEINHIKDSEDPESWEVSLRLLQSLLDKLKGNKQKGGG